MLHVHVPELSDGCPAAGKALLAALSEWKDDMPRRGSQAGGVAVEELRAAQRKYVERQMTNDHLSESGFHRCSG